MFCLSEPKPEIRWKCYCRLEAMKEVTTKDLVMSNREWIG